MSVKLKITETFLCKDKKKIYKFECQPNLCQYLGNKNIAIVFLIWDLSQTVKRRHC